METVKPKSKSLRVRLRGVANTARKKTVSSENTNKIAIIAIRGIATAQ
jgi:hypothetical protein